ncbi:MAG TPA: hypothetical protein VLJ39_12595, partial [Tepidisphaeraceae bacterium]|nr:hypothetical protein [Tepidisphaeraceae bacterium]
AAGRTGPLPAETVLNVQFCYEFFLLIADPPHPPAGAPAAAAGAGPETGGADAENILLWKRLGIAAIEKFLDDPAHNEIAAAARGRLHSLEHIELVDRNETAQAIRHLQDFSPLQKAGPSFDPKDVDPKTVVVVYLNGPAGGSWRIGVVFDKTTATTKAVVYVPGK